MYLAGLVQVLVRTLCAFCDELTQRSFRHWTLLMAEGQIHPRSDTRAVDVISKTYFFLDEVRDICDVRHRQRTGCRRTFEL